MTTEWKWGLGIWLAKTSVTPEAKAAFRQIYVDHGSGETAANEDLMWNSVRKYSATGIAPATWYGTYTPAKTTMRDAFLAWLSTYGATYVGVAAVDLPNYEENEVLQTNLAGVNVGDIITFDEAEAIFCSVNGLIRIPEVAV